MSSIFSQENHIAALGCNFHKEYINFMTLREGLTSLSILRSMYQKI